MSIRSSAHTALASASPAAFTLDRSAYSDLVAPIKPWRFVSALSLPSR
jgi:hypothetical protein